MGHGISSLCIHAAIRRLDSFAYFVLRRGPQRPGANFCPQFRKPPDSLRLHITFKDYKFNFMNVLEMIPAARTAADLMRSLSHPQRLLVLCRLVDGEKSVAELREELGVEQVPMSQQLMRLRADGLVEARREGTTVYYSIVRPEVLTVVSALYEAFCPPGAAEQARDGRQE